MAWAGQIPARGLASWRKSVAEILRSLQRQPAGAGARLAPVARTAVDGPVDFAGQPRRGRMIGEFPVPTKHKKPAKNNFRIS
jgi:hypothetical protein